MKGMTRRQFVAGSLAAGVFAVSSRYNPVLGANEDIRVAVIGFNGKGQTHIDAFSKMPGVRVVALCDADQAVLDRAGKKFADRGQKILAVQDMRKIFDSKEVDVIATATPNHWHSLCTVWACQAGKDVYVEKPVSHEVWEGRKCIEAARKYKRIVQAGTQSRSDQGLTEVIDSLKQGSLGKMTLVRGFCYKPRGSIGKVTGPQPPPATVDYDLWCGPAPKKPLMRKNFHYDWHWFWDTGNGDIGNQGIHEMDMCRWALGQKTIAPRVLGIGGRFVLDDDAETANTQIAYYDYKPVPMIFEVRGLPSKTGSNAMDAYKGVRIGLVIQCENGYYAGGGSGGWTYDKDGTKIKQYAQKGSGDHQANFIKAVRSRKIEDLKADINEGHLSSALCHMGNITYRLGKTKPPEEIAEMVKSDKDATDSFERFKSHVEANGGDLKKTPATLGPWLTMDTEKEQFTGEFAAEANKLVRREYRAPFVIPDQV